MSSAARIRFSGRRPLLGEPRSALRQLLEDVLEDHSRTGTVSVVFVGDPEIRRLHREYLGNDRPTDVMAFPLRGEDHDDPHPDDLAGEVVVSVDTASREAQRRGLPLERELALYSLHGVLHLVGFGDANPEARRRMRQAERKYLRRFRY